jgi:predicted RNase H-like nuclease (RuvC/YqgF family)
MNKRNVTWCASAFAVASLVGILMTAHGQRAGDSGTSRPQMTTFQLQAENRRLKQLANMLPGYVKIVAQQQAEIKTLRQQTAILQRTLIANRLPEYARKVAHQQRDNMMLGWEITSLRQDLMESRNREAILRSRLSAQSSKAQSP